MGRGGHGHSHSPSGKHAHSHSPSKSHDHSHQHSHVTAPVFFFNLISTLSNLAPAKFLGCCVCSDTLRLGIMLSMILTFFVIELIVGQISHSISMIADSFHMLSDALALVIGIVTAVMSSRSSTKNTYGWVRAEVLGSLVNSVFLCSMCLGILIEAVKHLFEPHKLHDIDLLICTGILGLVINLLGLFVFGHGHSHGPSHEPDKETAELGTEDGVELEVRVVEDSALARSRAIEEGQALNANGTVDKARSKRKKRCCVILSSEANLNIRAVFLHVLADALGSVVVIVSALVNKFQTDLNVPKQVIDYIDPVLCLLLVALILATALPVVKESALILLQAVPKNIEVSALKRDLQLHVPHILSVDELHIWKLSGRENIATGRVIFQSTSEYIENSARIEAFFRQRGIQSTTIQPEFSGHDSRQQADMEKTCCIE